MQERAPIRIMLVEDSPSDARLIQECLGEIDTPNEVFVVNDGERAVNMLRRDGESAESFEPDLVLLDLDLPKLNGHEVLEQVKADEKMRRIPVIVLTSSAIAEDIHRAYQLQANCYLSKPLGVEGYVDLVGSIEAFWLNHAQLPSGS